MKESLFLIITLSLVLNVSCSRDKVVTEKERFAKLYVLLQFSVEKNRPDVNAMKIDREKILKQFNLTEKQYESTFDYYGQDAERWKSFFEEVNSQLVKVKKKTS